LARFGILSLVTALGLHTSLKIADLTGLLEGCFYSKYSHNYQLSIYEAAAKAKCLGVVPTLFPHGNGVG